METVCLTTPLMSFLSGTEKYHAGFDCLKYIKTSNPASLTSLFVCIPRQPIRLWIRGDIDAYISLQEPLYHWRASLLKWSIADIAQKKPTALSLTPGEWRVLKDLRKGLDMRYIAETEQLSYRRVSVKKLSDKKTWAQK